MSQINPMTMHADENSVAYNGHVAMRVVADTTGVVMEGDGKAEIAVVLMENIRKWDALLG
jgi:hypothetical protein